MEVMTVSGESHVEASEFGIDTDGDLYLYKDGEDDPVAMFNRDSYIGVVREYGDVSPEDLP